MSETQYSKSLSSTGGYSTVELALFFAALAIAAALFLPSLVNHSVDYIAINSANIDRTTVGSVQGKKRYIVRRSILGPDKEVINLKP